MKSPLNKNITDLLPHREPFLFLDKIVSVDGTTKITAEKKINEDEGYFKGHFPGNPIVPGVLIIESMAQASGIIAAYNQGKQQELYFLSRISDIKFKYPVFPGDTLIIKAEIVGSFDQAVKAFVSCEVKGMTVAEGELVLTSQKGRRR